MSLALLLVSLILMPNSLAPTPYPVDYVDFTATEIVETYSDSASEYTYTTTIENTGLGYISIKDTKIINSAGDAILAKGLSSPYCYMFEEYIAPSKSVEVSFTSKVIFDCVKIKCFGYPTSSFDSEATSSNYSTVYNPQFIGKIYGYSFYADFTYNLDYDYNILVTYTYNGVSKTVGTTEYYNNIISFKSSSYMEISKIKIDDLVFIPCEMSQAYDDKQLSVFLMVISFGAISLIVFASIAFFGILIAITLLIMKAVERSKNKAHK